MIPQPVNQNLNKLIEILIGTRTNRSIGISIGYTHVRRTLAASEWHPQACSGVAVQQALLYPVLVVSTYEFLGALGVQNVESAGAECAAAPVLRKRLFCPNKTQFDQHTMRSASYFTCCDYYWPVVLMTYR